MPQISTIEDSLAGNGEGQALPGSLSTVLTIAGATSKPDSSATL